MLWGMVVLALPAHDFVYAFDDSINLLRRNATEPPPEPCDGKRSNLTHLRPRTFGEFRASNLERKRKARPGLLARHGNRDDGPGPVIENVVTQNDNRANA